MEQKSKKLELRKVKHSASLSKETYAYTATVYVDGRAFCNVQNHGHGGADMQFPVKPFTDADILELDKWMGANLPAVPSGYVGIPPLVSTLELWCGEQVAEYLVAKDMQRALKSKLLFEVDGTVHETHFKGVRTLSELHLKGLIQSIKSKYPEARILNTMSHDEALAIYRKAATF